jgi:hypothetical protein
MKRLVVRRFVGHPALGEFHAMGRCRFTLQSGSGA